MCVSWCPDAYQQIIGILYVTVNHNRKIVPMERVSRREMEVHVLMRIGPINRCNSGALHRGPGVQTSVGSDPTAPAGSLQIR